MRWLSLRPLLIHSCLGAAALAVVAHPGHAAPLVGPGRDTFDRETGTIQDATNTLNYELFRPPGHTAEGDLPLVVYLHGFGDGRGSKRKRLNDTMHDLIHATQRDNVTRGVSASEAGAYDDAYASFVLVPKVPVAESWYPRLGLVKQLIDDAVDQYNIDSSRIYLSGFSNGGFNTLAMIAQYPGLFAAGVSLAGGGTPSDSFVAALKDTPLWFFHDKTDSAVPYAYSADMADALNEAGGSANLSLFDGGYGHNSWRPAWADAEDELYPWLFSQQVPEPTTGGLVLLGAATLMRRRRA